MRSVRREERRVAGVAVVGSVRREARRALREAALVPGRAARVAGVAVVGSVRRDGRRAWREAAIHSKLRVPVMDHARVLQTSVLDAPLVLPVMREALS